MSIFIRSYNYEMWDVVLDGPYVPMKTKKGSEALKPKLWNEWTESCEENASELQSNQYSSLRFESYWVQHNIYVQDS